MCLLSAHGDAFYFKFVSWACIFTVVMHTLICLTCMSLVSCIELKRRIKRRRRMKKFFNQLIEREADISAAREEQKTQLRYISSGVDNNKIGVFRI